MKVAENRFLSGPRAGAGAVAANETGTRTTVARRLGVRISHLLALTHSL